MSPPMQDLQHIFRRENFFVSKNLQISVAVTTQAHWKHVNTFLEPLNTKEGKVERSVVVQIL